MVTSIIQGGNHQHAYEEEAAFGGGNIERRTFALSVETTLSSRSLLLPTKSLQVPSEAYRFTSFSQSWMCSKDS